MCNLLCISAVKLAAHFLKPPAASLLVGPLLGCINEKIFVLKKFSIISNYLKIWNFDIPYFFFFSLSLLRFTFVEHLRIRNSDTHPYSFSFLLWLDDRKQCTVHKQTIWHFYWKFNEQQENYLQTAMLCLSMSRRLTLDTASLHSVPSFFQVMLPIHQI